IEFAEPLRRCEERYIDADQDRGPRRPWCTDTNVTPPGLIVRYRPLPGEEVVPSIETVRWEDLELPLKEVVRLLVRFPDRGCRRDHFRADVLAIEVPRREFIDSSLVETDHRS